MKNILLLIIVTGSMAYSQTIQKSAENKSLSLEQRFIEMKATAQTFKDYKVIKEDVLDRVWKITKDTINKRNQDLTDARSQMAFFQEELETARNAMQAQEASINEVVYDSTHISVLGIPFSKGFFQLFVAAVVGSLLFVLSIFYGRMKLLNALVKEKALISESISHELEDFKKKAMEKQTKLSRELQNERNKWVEARKG